ncbi:MAG: hypothetical protein U9M94_00485 [Patescibacteria group bacterium]|nr:hypothetical protein [Patescibacteria group bacterium]
MRIIAKELFYVTGSAFLIYFIMEIFWTGIVLSYFNINWVLLLWLIIAILIVLIPDKKNGNK